MTSTTWPKRMRCIEISTPGGPDVLKLTERPTPVPGPGDVLVAVRAAGVNRPDLLQRRGKYPPPPGASDLPGLEIAGRIVGVGEAVTALAVGDEACALVAGGGYAEYCVVPAPQCLPIPAGLDMVSAAALPETCLTVWTNVFERGRLQPGETLLVHGGTSGIGTTAIQLGRAFGARVFATAGSHEKCRACELLGAERGINYREDDFVAVVREATSGHGADVILDMVGGDYVARNLSLLALEGRLVQIAFLKGSLVQIDLSTVMRQRLVVTGSTLRARSVEEKGAIARAVEARVWPLVAAGVVRPVVHAVFSLAEASAAHAVLEEGRHVGKVVLRVDT